MNKYNIKVGDYVETWDGGIGYVTNADLTEFYWFIVTPRSVPNATKAGEETIASFDAVKTYYKRIGKNDFTKKENKFEPITKYNQNGIITYTDKLNELINHINVIQERLNEYDSTRTD